MFLPLRLLLPLSALMLTSSVVAAPGSTQATATWTVQAETCEEEGEQRVCEPSARVRHAALEAVAAKVTTRGDQLWATDVAVAAGPTTLVADQCVGDLSRWTCHRVTLLVGDQRLVGERADVTLVDGRVDVWGDVAVSLPYDEPLAATSTTTPTAALPGM